MSENFSQAADDQAGETTTRKINLGRAEKKITIVDAILILATTEKYAEILFAQGGLQFVTSEKEKLVANEASELREWDIPVNDLARLHKTCEMKWTEISKRNKLARPIQPGTTQKYAIEQMLGLIETQTADDALRKMAPRGVYKKRSADELSVKAAIAGDDDINDIRIKKKDKPETVVTAPPGAATMSMQMFEIKSLDHWPRSEPLNNERLLMAMAHSSQRYSGGGHCGAGCVASQPSGRRGDQSIGV